MLSNIDVEVFVTTCSTQWLCPMKKGGPKAAVLLAQPVRSARQQRRAQKQRIVEKVALFAAAPFVEKLQQSAHAGQTSRRRFGQGVERGSLSAAGLLVRDVVVGIPDIVGYGPWRR